MFKGFLITILFGILLLLVNGVVSVNNEINKIQKNVDKTGEFLCNVDFYDCKRKGVSEDLCWFDRYNCLKHLTSDPCQFAPKTPWCEVTK